jgi:uncharacterized protein YuzE
MKTYRSHFFAVHSNNPPLVEFDAKASAYYIHFAKKGTRVAKTVPVCEGPEIIAVDLDSKDRVVGIEAIGVQELQVGKIAAKARVDVSQVNLAGQKIRVTPPRVDFKLAA